jgi:glutamyl-tRNA synthetase
MIDSVPEFFGRTPSMTIEKPRVRFAPSPTGYLHVGGARTALFNWLFARNQAGTFVLRVEDTDVERNRPELVQGILDDLRWLGIGWDEGPFFQSERLDLYREAAARLLHSGAAYPCFCPPSQYAGADAREESDEDESSSAPVLRPACPCRNLGPADREAKMRGGLAYAIRFAVPREGTTRFQDEVFGEREVENAELEDFVLQRSTGLPTYQLSVVVDDIAMGITHVIRGADHLSNTPKQVLLYRALGAPPPVFAHVPLILGPDRTRLSKRHGATSVGAYAEEGFLPEAFRNFLILLGWSTGDDTELLGPDEMVRRFSLAGVSRTNAVFDRAKLEWFNVQYLQQLPIGALLPYVEQTLRRAGLWREEWAGAERPWLARAVDLIRPRTRLLSDFTTWSRAFFSDEFDYEETAKEKFWKDDRLPAMLEKLSAALAASPEWNHDSCERALRDLAVAEGVKAALLINATRVALVGRAVAPPLFETMVVLGCERVLRRIARALPFIPAR